MTEYEIEPTPGLPGRLPPGERILWQGAPEWRALAVSAFRTRWVAGYFAVLALVAGMVGTVAGVGVTMALGVAAVGLLHLLAWGSARTTLYTLTNRRIVLRVGMAVPKCVNLPLRRIASVDLAVRGAGGDVALTLVGAPKLGYLALWPHARPLRITRPQPMLRALPDAATVAKHIARSCLAANPAGQLSVAPTAPQAVPDFAGAQAA